MCGFLLGGFLEEAGIELSVCENKARLPLTSLGAGAAAVERALYSESHSLSRGQVTHSLWVSVCLSVKWG